MNKVIAFSKRNFLEIVRDPLSYIFCLGFPLVMLVVMTLINDSIPAEAEMTIFRIDNLAGGIAVFGLSFVMLFVCLSVSKDRSGAFLTRLYATPMKSRDFILGYVFPTSLIALVQGVITFISAFIISKIVDVEIKPSGLILAELSLLPSILLMISLGLLFGTLFGEKAAPGLCSIVISLGSFLGSVFFDAEQTGGILLKICNVLPFFHAVKVARLACSLESDGYVFHLIITIAYATVVTIISILVFNRKMRADLK